MMKQEGLMQKGDFWRTQCFIYFSFWVVPRKIIYEIFGGRGRCNVF